MAANYGADDLPPKFTQEERDTYIWLYDCQVQGWLVDVKTKRVTGLTFGEFESLIKFKEHLVQMYAFMPFGEATPHE